MTLDGKIASFAGSSQWISNEESRAKVHKLRGRMDGILIGRGTLIADDPLLTARPAGPRTATRIVLTSGKESLPDDCQLLRTLDQAPVMIITGATNVERLQAWSKRGAEIVGLNDLSIAQVLAELGRRRMTNLLVEGGAGVLGSFLDAGLIDEVHAFIAPKLIGGKDAISPIGGKGFAQMSEAFAFENVRSEMIGNDVYVNAHR